MSSIVGSKESLPKKNAATLPVKDSNRLCIHCSKSKPLTEFYSNKDWSEQLGKDVWCKECLNKCTTKDEVREYFWENHREWNEKIWEKAKSKAEKLAADNVVYQKTTEERRKLILDQLTCKQVPTIMSLHYKYFDTSKASNATSYQEAKENGEIVEEDPSVKVYREEFNGYFKANEYEYLKSYYKNLENDFDLNTENLRDYARKLAKSSLQADKAQDDYSMGKCDFSVVKDAMMQFDMLSKSANFAECKRKPGDAGGVSSFSELSLKLETSGHSCTRKIEWPPDDVDKTINEFYHIVEAINFN